jgi:integrase
MSVSKRTWTNPSGEAREAWVVRYYDSDGKYRMKTFKRGRDAKAWEAQKTVDIAKGTHRPERTSVTIKDAGALWLQRCLAENLEPEAVRPYEQHLRLHIYPAVAPVNVPNAWKGQLGDLKLCHLKTPMCEAFKELVLTTKKRRRGSEDKIISRRMAGHILSSLKMMLNDAQKRGLIDFNPAGPVRIVSKGREDAPLEAGVEIPDRADIRAILIASEGFWRALFMTLSFTGMRSSELRGLVWRKVNLDRGIVEISQRADQAGKIGFRKSKSAYRTVSLPTDLVEELRRWKSICPSNSLDLVFPNSDGGVLPMGDILRKLRELQERLGIVRLDKKPKFHVHSLRHFFVSVMIDEGTPPKRLQTLIGHSVISTTMDIYGHLFEGRENEATWANKAMASVFANREVESDQTQIEVPNDVDRHDDKFCDEDDMAEENQEVLATEWGI